jgi:hypothetical protein
MNQTTIDKLPVLINDILASNNDDELNAVLQNLDDLLFTEQYSLLLKPFL